MEESVVFDQEWKNLLLDNWLESMFKRHWTRAMELNQADIVCFDFKVDDDGCFLGNCPDVKVQNFLNFFDDDVDDESDDESDRDIVDLLPNDPFDMEQQQLNVALPTDPFVMGIEISLPKDPFEMECQIGPNLAGFTSWSLRGYEFDADQATEEDDDKDFDDFQFVAGLNFYWAGSLIYELEGDNDVGDGENGHEKKENSNDVDGGEPADALLFALSYLDVKDLLTLERVCKTLFDAVRDETLVWKNITIDYPLSNKITNDRLLQLTNRAKGTLCSLSLSKCFKITNAGLKQVLERNPGLKMLSVQGCIRLNVEGILRDVKAFNSDAVPGITRLRIGHMTGLTDEHFGEFKFLLGSNDNKNATCSYKPRFYRDGEMDLSLEDERSIDIETCPGCGKPRQVYDCPSEPCKEKIHSEKACRGCIFCIPRCGGCGCCLENRDFYETFLLDCICLECLHHLLNSSGGGNNNIHQRPSYHFILCG